jgi:hypothetical protein
MSKGIDTNHHVPSKSVFAERSFWLRTVEHMKSDLTVTALTVRNIGGLVLVMLLGILLFILEFKLVKEFVVYALIVPFSIYCAVRYFTVLPVVFTIAFLFIKPKHSTVLISLVVVFSFIWVLLV